MDTVYDRVLSIDLLTKYMMSM